MYINIFVTSYTSITMLAFFQYWLVSSLNTACDWMCSVKRVLDCVKTSVTTEPHQVASPTLHLPRAVVDM